MPQNSNIQTNPKKTLSNKDIGLGYPKGINDEQRKLWDILHMLLKFMINQEQIKISEVRDYLKLYYQIPDQGKIEFCNQVTKLSFQKLQENGMMTEVLAYQESEAKFNKIMSMLSPNDQIVFLEALNKDQVTPELRATILGQNEDRGVTEEDIQYLAETATQRYKGREGLRINEPGGRKTFTNTRPMTIEDLTEFITTGRTPERDIQEEEVELPKTQKPLPPPLDPTNKKNSSITPPPINKPSVSPAPVQNSVPDNRPQPNNQPINRNQNQQPHNHPQANWGTRPVSNTPNVALGYNPQSNFDNRQQVNGNNLQANRPIINQNVPPIHRPQSNNMPNMAPQYGPRQRPPITNQSIPNPAANYNLPNPQTATPPHTRNNRGIDDLLGKK